MMLQAIPAAHQGHHRRAGLAAAGYFTG